MFISLTEIQHIFAGLDIYIYRGNGRFPNLGASWWFKSVKMPFAGEEVEEEVGTDDGRPVAEGINKYSQLKGRMMLPPRALSKISEYNIRRHLVVCVS